MTGEKCIACKDRFPGCQDHCEYGQAAKAERQKKKAQQENKQERAAKIYYLGKNTGGRNARILQKNQR